MFVLCIFIAFSMWSFEIYFTYSCVCLYFYFIVVDSLFMAVLAETCCWLYDKIAVP
jgi:uncharacterized membrane protein (GlpM family)